MLDLESVRAFVVFSEQMNFTQAARQLHLSQPALHARVQKLASELGVPLYQRHGRRLVLTQAGEEVVRFGRETLNKTLDFKARLRGRAQHQPVVLAAGEGSYLYLLGDAIQTFRRAEEAPLRLLSLAGEEALDAVRRGLAHLAVTAMEVVDDAIVAEEMVDVGLSLVMPAADPLASKDSITLEDLEGRSLIVPPPGHEHRRVLEASLRRRGVRWEVAVEASGWPLMLRFVELGLGLAVVNAFCPAPPGCVARSLMGLPVRTYLLLRHRDSSLDDAAERLRALILQVGKR